MTVVINGTTGITTPNSVTEQTPSTTTAAYYYWNNGSINVAAVAGYSDSSTAGHLEFYTTTGSTLSEIMRITADGKVGIGIAAPSAVLNPAAPTQTDNTKSALFEIGRAHV